MPDMDIEIENEKENKLLNRRELTLKVYHNGEATPERTTVRKKVADLTGFSNEKVIIEKVDSEFGKDESTVVAKVYDNADDAKTYERKHILERNK